MFKPLEHMTALDIVREVEKCKFDQDYCARTYAYIDDKKTRQRMLFRRNKEQRAIRRALRTHDKVFVLKARKKGASTEAQWEGFHMAHFFEGFKAATLAHLDKAVLEMMVKCHNFYRGFPDFLKQGAFKLRRQREDRLEWEHGGWYRAVPYRSEEIRSGDVDFLHYSEFSAYDNAEEVLAANDGALRPGGKSLYETTARGMGFAYEAWKANNGWAKLFFSWITDPTYMRTKQLMGLDPTLYEWAMEYAKQYGLTQPQRWWVEEKLATYCAGGLNPIGLQKFHQEYPITADVAFSMTAGRVFTVAFPHARVTTGIKQFEEPKPYALYTMGVDCATGAIGGDYSAFCIIDGTDRKKPRIVCTFYDHISTPDFFDVVHRYAKAYSALIIPERNMGMDLIARLQQARYPYIWVEQAKSKRGNQRTNRVGFQTYSTKHGGAVGGSRKLIVDKLLEFLGGAVPVLSPVCERLQTEINDFMYMDDGRGRADHKRGSHSDMLFACGLGLIGMEGLQSHKDMRSWRRPVTMTEKRQYRKVTGKRFNPDDRFEEDIEEELESIFPTGRRKRRLRSLQGFVDHGGRGL